MARRWSSRPGAPFLAVLALFAQAARGDVEDDLGKARAEIARLTERIRHLSEDQASLGQEVELREAERQRAERRSKEAALIQAEAERLHGEAAQAAAAAVRELEGVKRALAAQARASYEASRISPASVALRARGVDDAFFVWAMAGAVARRSARAAALLDATRRESERRTEVEQERADAARSAAAEAETRKGEERAARDRAKQLLAGILEERQSYEKLLAEEVAHARRLEALVKDIGERPGPAAGPGNILEKKGALPWPAPGQVVGTFGKHKHPRFPTYTVRSGIVIDAPDGTAVACIEAGRVVFADWFTGYGKLVIVDHGDKVYSLYARVDELEVKVGDVVAAGQVIARVADPGGADVRGLYFEIRRGAQAVDPLGWLSRRSP